MLLTVQKDSDDCAKQPLPQPATVDNGRMKGDSKGRTALDLPMGHWCESGGDSIFSNTCVNRKTSLSEADGSFHSRINHLPVTKCSSWGKVILSSVRSLPVGYPAAGTIFFTQHTDPLVISILEKSKTIHGKSTAMHLFYLKPTELGSRA